MFNNGSMEIWEGESIDLTATAADDTFKSATLLVGTEGEPAVFSKTVDYVNGVADLSVPDEENTIPSGDYKLMIRVDYVDGNVKFFPSPKSCPFTDLPSLIVKKKIEESV